MRYNPLQLLNEVVKHVVRERGGVEERKYYRFRPSRFYGGSAVADAVGCILRCGFCWGWRVNSSPESYGEFYSPSEVAVKLISIARSRGYLYARVSGGEPTIARKHLIQLLAELRARGFGKNHTFILETNGILIGYDPSYARELAEYRFIHVRVSIKGCTPEIFETITGADKSFFELQIQALKNLLDAGVSVHPAVMVSFCSREDIEYLTERLRDIDERLVHQLEDEVVILYPHVVELLKRRGLRPRIAIDPRSWNYVTEV